MFREMMRRIRYWQAARERDDELQQELEFHADMRARRNEESGLNREEAHRRAGVALGNTAILREDARGAWIWPWLDNTRIDFRYALRGLRRQPSYAIAVILTLALGIGANTSVFTVIQALLLKDLPVRNPNELFVLTWSVRNDRPAYKFGGSGRKVPDSGRFVNNVFSHTSFVALRDGAGPFADVMAFAHLRGCTIATNTFSSANSVFAVSGNFYQVLGVTPRLGRLIEPQDDSPAAAPVAVISHGLWQRAFGGRAEALGGEIKVNGAIATVIGVTPPEFTGVSRGGWIGAPEVTVPLHAHAVLAKNYNVTKTGFASASFYSDPQVYWVQLMARIPSRGVEPAFERLRMLLAQSEAERGTVWTDKGDLPLVEFSAGNRGLDTVRRQFGEPLRILMSVVAVVLMVACANVAGLMLARGAARRREVAFRLALGASRFRLVRQFLVECLVLAGIGAALGLAIAYPGAPLLLSMLSSPGNENAVTPAPDSSVLLFTLFILILTVLFVGVTPAVAGTSLGNAHAVGAQRSLLLRGRWQRQPLRSVLVAAQVALSLVLLVTAGLFLRTIVNLRAVDAGFKTDELVVFSMSPSKSGYTTEQAQQVYTRVTEALERTPGVAAVSYAADRMLADWNSTSLIRVPGQRVDRPRSISWNAVGPRYLSTAGIQFLAGRDIQASDSERASLVAVVNRSAATELFGGSPLGQTFYRMAGGKEVEVHVVGVVEDALQSTIRAGKRPSLYLPHAQTMASAPGVDFLVRTAIEPRSMLAPIRAAARGVDPFIPLIDLKTQDMQIDGLMNRERMFTVLTSLFASLTLLMSCIGLYGVISYGVTWRISEIGVRVTLGASAASILWLLLRGGLRLVAAGAAISVPLIWISLRVVRSQLFGVADLDTGATAVATLTLFCAAGVAALIPATRAAFIAPAEALRHE